MIWGILFLATILRLININQSLWLDEASQALMSQRSIASIIFERTGDFHPPLSYLLFHYWMMISNSDVWLRLLPIIFGVATVFVIYKICQKMFGEKVALISALFLATAPYHVYYSQEIRMYSMATFFASLSMYYFITRKPLGYVISSAALIYAHYMGGLLIISQVIYFFITEKKNFLGYTKLLLLIFILYLPWIPELLNQLQNGVKVNQYLPGWEKILSLDPIKALPLIFIKFSIGRISFDNQLVYLGISTVVLISFGFLIYRSLRSKKQTKLIAFWLFIPIIITWLISFIIPINQPFRLLFTVPAFYMLLAVGVGSLERFWRLGILGVLIISISGLLIYWTNPKFQREDWRTATKDIRENAIFAWPIPFDPYIWYGGKGIGVIKDFPAKEEEIDLQIKNLGMNEVYLFEYLQDLSDPHHLVQKKLIENGYTLKKTINYNGVGLVDKFIK